MQIKEKYKDYLHLILIAENKGSVEFYKRLGFRVTDGATPMLIMNR